MNWNNYGIVWQLDHVKPCCSFNFQKDSEVKECFTWKNTRPLFSDENNKKSGKYDINIIETHKLLVEIYEFFTGEDK